MTDSTAPRGGQRCAFSEAKNSRGRLPAPRALSRTSRRGLLPRVLATPSGSREGVSLDSHQGISPQGPRPLSPRWGAQTPTPGESRRRPRAPPARAARCAPHRPSPVRGCVPGGCRGVKARPSLAGTRRGCLSQAQEQPGRGGGEGTSGAVRLPWPPPASPASRGRRWPRVTLEPPPT